MHTIAHAHAGGPSCLWADDTNKGCWRFDSTRQAAAAQQGRPFTACQPALLQEPPTKSHRMWDSQRDDGDTVTSNLRHAGMQKDKHTHTQIHILVILSSPCLQWNSSWPVRLSVTLMRLLSYVQILCPPSFASPPKLSLFSLSQLKELCSCDTTNKDRKSHEEIK